jgi:serine/threonine-protein kinase
MCGTLNPTLLQYCQACGTTLRQATSKATLAAPHLWAAASAPPPLAPAASAGSTLAAPVRVVAAQQPVPEPTRSLQVETYLAGLPGEGRVDNDAFDASVASIVPGARSSKRRWMTRIGLVILVIAGGLGFAFRSRSLRLPYDMGETRALFRAVSTAVAGTSATGAPSTVPLASTAAPASLSSVSVNARPAAAKASFDIAGLATSGGTLAIPRGMGLLNTTNAAPGHRIFVDGRTVGQTPQSVLVKCGRAAVKIGSAGHSRALDIPCGREIRVGR